MAHCNSPVTRRDTWFDGARLTLVLMLGCAALAHAQDTAELSDDFLEYLGNMESTEDNWTDFAAEKSAAHATESPSSDAATSKGTDTQPPANRANAQPVEPVLSHNAKPANAPAPKASK